MRLSPRWQKLQGDISVARGRILMMVIAIAVGVFSITAISSSYSVLNREIGRNFLATNPAAALIEVLRLDEKAVATARAQPGITGAEAAGRISGRVRVRPDEWLPLLLFVVPDLSAARISTVRLESGRWPAGPNSIVLERTALSVANTALEHGIELEGPNGTRRTFQVTGAVHDPSLAPAWQEQTVYGYVTPEALNLLGEDPSLNVLRLSVMNPVGDRPGLQRAVIQVADRLRSMGYSVGEIRIPPYQHPHQGMMSSVLQMLLAFSVLSLILSAVLTAALTSTLLAPQVRQIAVMKAIGARSGQILLLYTSLIAAIGLSAVTIGLPLGIVAGRALALNTARLLNLELENLSVPAWVFWMQILAGIGLPLAAAIIPIKRATQRTVSETLNDFGARLPKTAPGSVIRWLSHIRPRDTAYLMAIRNSVRHRGRLAFILALLATAGALFMTSMNMKAAWQHSLSEAVIERHFDTEFQFVKSESARAVIAAASAVAGVRRVEPWTSESVSLARPDGLRIVNTFADGGHGSLRIQALPPNSIFLTPRMIVGRWLTVADSNVAVVNEQALSTFPGLHVGDAIRLMIRGRVAELHVIGIVREHLTQANVYVAQRPFEQIVAEPGRTRGIRVSLESKDERSIRDATANITQALDRAGFKVAGSISQTQSGRALGGHLFILIFTLVVMSILMALVGVLGLSATTTISVLERTREFAVMRAIGAGGGIIRRSIIGEAVFVSILSVGIASLLSLPLTVVVARVVGSASLGPDLSTVLSMQAIPLWLAIIVIAAVVASVSPALRASKLTIREALSFQ